MAGPTAKVTDKVRVLNDYEMRQEEWLSVKGSDKYSWRTALRFITNVSIFYGPSRKRFGRRQSILWDSGRPPGTAVESK